MNRAGVQRALAASQGSSSQLRPSREPLSLVRRVRESEKPGYMQIHARSSRPFFHDGPALPAFLFVPCSPPRRCSSFATYPGSGGRSPAAPSPAARVVSFLASETLDDTLRYEMAIALGSSSPHLFLPRSGVLFQRAASPSVLSVLHPFPCAASAAAAPLLFGRAAESSQPRKSTQLLTFRVPRLFAHRPPTTPRSLLFSFSTAAAPVNYLLRRLR